MIRIVDAAGVADSVMHAEIDRFFDKDGPLSQAVDGYRHRGVQAEMAKAVAAAIGSSSTLVAEAGTGTGKTFAYLVPALVWGGKVIVSTGSKNLQDQLFLRDIPVIRRMLGLPVTVALLKGRSNYLCLHHLEQNLADGRFSSRAEAHDLSEIARFARATKTGDRADLAHIPENAAAWARATSTRETCRGAECSKFDACFVMKARRQALEADVVVVNHHLFFADLALRDTGIAELLPSANTVIFDEAHQLSETATLFFGDRLTIVQLTDLCLKIRSAGLAHARDGADWPRLADATLHALQRLRLAVPEDLPRVALDQLASRRAFDEAVLALGHTFRALSDAVARHALRAEELSQYSKLAVERMEQLAEWLTAADGDDDMPETGTGAILWLESAGGELQLHRSPLSIAPIVHRQREDSRCAWIFTSATLSVAGDFSHFVLQLGLDRARCLSWPSPFNYGEQGLLYMPADMPDPSAPHYPEAAAQAALPVIEAAGGRTFFLCTTLRAVERVARSLKSLFFQRGLPFPLLVQGEKSRGALLDHFRNAQNAVLVGSQAFWEGVDMKGEVLSVVVIDKLPFAPPDDPVFAARLKAYEKNGLSPFMHYQLPEAIISLRQGAGRLIRDEEDRGVLMICDPRLHGKGYGRRIERSLPPFRRSRDIDEVRAFFAR